MLRAGLKLPRHISTLGRMFNLDSHVRDLHACDQSRIISFIRPPTAAHFRFGNVANTILILSNEIGDSQNHVMFAMN